MTNEEFAVAIKAGKTELLPELYDQVRLFIAKTANKWLLSFGNGRGVEHGDLMNCGYIAVVEAVDWWRPDGEQSFLGALSYALKTQFCVAYGVRTSKQAKDLLHNAVSLSTPTSEDSDATIGDIIEDAHAAEAFDEIDERDYQHSLHEALERALNTLPEAHSAAVRLRYYQGEKYASIGAALGTDAIRAQEFVKKALTSIRRSSRARPLTAFLDFDYYHGSGLQSYVRTQMSIQERYLMKKERREGASFGKR